MFFFKNYINDFGDYFEHLQNGYSSSVLMKWYQNTYFYVLSSLSDRYIPIHTFCFLSIINNVLKSNIFNITIRFSKNILYNITEQIGSGSYVGIEKYYFDIVLVDI
jgi:hypothetical protein